MLAAFLVSFVALAVNPVVTGGARAFIPPEVIPQSGSIVFVSNAANDSEYGRIATVPVGFGAGEFTLTIWVRFTTGTASSFAFGDAAERTDWDAANATLYGATDWWFHGNFVIDGHNNNGGAFYDGTLSLQIFNSGRPRWTFGDGAAANARTGDLHGIQNSASASLRDGNWHRLAFVRRFDGGSGSILESWVDATMVDSETSSSRTNMYTGYWDDFTAQPSAQRGFFFGAEKQAAVGVLSQFADTKGNFSETAFWERALSEAELADLGPFPDSAQGLLDIIRYAEGSGTTAEGANGTTMTLHAGAGGQAVTWSSANPF